MKGKSFNKPYLDSLKPMVGQYEIVDKVLPGLSLRVSPGGTKTFNVTYRFKGHKRRQSLGRYPYLSISDAREKVRQILGQLASDIDPKPQSTSQLDYQSMRYDTLTQRFIGEYARPKTKGWKQTERILANNFRSWRSIRIDQIHKSMVWISLQDLAKARGAQSALRSFAALRKFFSWCVELEYLSRSPCERLQLPWKQVKRERVLSNEEIGKIWRAAEVIGYPFGNAVQILLLTGQRRCEVSGMRWIDLDEEQAIWIQPTNKADRIHEVPLSVQAQDIFQRLPRCSSTWVFPSRTNSTPISGFNKWKDSLDRISGVTGWRLHDLRRTVRTRMASLRVPSDVVVRILNHSVSNRSAVEEIYNRYDYRLEKREALQQWADALLTIVADTKPLAHAA